MVWEGGGSTYWWGKGMGMEVLLWISSMGYLSVALSRKCGRNREDMSWMCCCEDLVFGNGNERARANGS